MSGKYIIKNEAIYGYKVFESAFFLKDEASLEVQSLLSVSSSIQNKANIDTHC